MPRKLIAVACFALLGWLPGLMGNVRAETALSQDNRSLSVTTGNTYQTIAPADNTRQMIQIENNTIDSTNTHFCYVNDDGLIPAGSTTSTPATTLNGTVTAAKASILLAPNGGAYTRYNPVPSGPLVATCAFSGDSLYVGIH
jgi:hypothetical protein